MKQGIAVFAILAITFYDFAETSANKHVLNCIVMNRTQKSAQQNSYPSTPELLLNPNAA